MHTHWIDNKYKCFRGPQQATTAASALAGGPPEPYITPVDWVMNYHKLTHANNGDPSKQNPRPIFPFSLLSPTAYPAQKSSPRHIPKRGPIPNPPCAAHSAFAPSPPLRYMCTDICYRCPRIQECPFILECGLGLLGARIHCRHRHRTGVLPDQWSPVEPQTGPLWAVKYCCAWKGNVEEPDATYGYSNERRKAIQVLGCKIKLMGRMPLP